MSRLENEIKEAREKNKGMPSQKYILKVLETVLVLPNIPQEQCGELLQYIDYSSIDPTSLYLLFQKIENPDDRIVTEWFERAVALASDPNYKDISFNDIVRDLEELYRIEYEEKADALQWDQFDGHTVAKHLQFLILNQYSDNIQQQTLKTEAAKRVLGRFRAELIQSELQFSDGESDDHGYRSRTVSMEEPHQKLTVPENINQQETEIILSTSSGSPSSPLIKGEKTHDNEPISVAGTDIVEASKKSTLKDYSKFFLNLSPGLCFYGIFSWALASKFDIHLGSVYYTAGFILGALTAIVCAIDAIVKSITLIRDYRKGDKSKKTLTGSSLSVLSLIFASAGASIFSASLMGVHLSSVLSPSLFITSVLCMWVGNLIDIFWMPNDVNKEQQEHAKGSGFKNTIRFFFPVCIGIGAGAFLNDIFPISSGPFSHVFHSNLMLAAGLVGVLLMTINTINDYRGENECRLLNWCGSSPNVNM